MIHRRGPWKTKQAVELATLEWVAWFNHHRLMEPLGYIPTGRVRGQLPSTTLVGPRPSDLNQRASAIPRAIQYDAAYQRQQRLDLCETSRSSWDVAQVLDEARLWFFQERLEFQADRESSLKHLQERYDEFLKG